MNFFENKDERCPAAKPIGWWIFKTQPKHQNIEILSIKRWGLVSWRKWEVDMKCLDCGAHINRFGISETELIAAGICPQESSQ